MARYPAGSIIHVQTVAQRNALSASSDAEGNEVVALGQLVFVADTETHYRWDGSTWDVFGAGGGGVSSIAKSGSAALTGDVTLSEGANVTLTQAGQDIQIAATGAAGAPSTVDYLVGTADAGLSAEIVVGTSPGGELGGTWASPTVDVTHSGSAHHTQSHDHSAAGDGTTLSPAALNIPNAAAPAPTTEGQAAWDNDDNYLRIGDGAASKDFFPTVDATSDPLAVSTAAADGTEKTTARKDHVHPHEAAHIAHDTVWAAKGDLITGTANDTAAVTTVGADDTILMADSAAAGGVKWVASASPSAVAAAAATGTADTFTRGDHVHAHGTGYAGAHSDHPLKTDLDAVTFTIGAFFETTGTLTTGVRVIWRAPFACTVTQVRGYADVGTTTVINAGKDAASSSDFCSSNITLSSAATWTAGTVNQNTSISSGDLIAVEIVTAGTATELTIQIELTRDLSP